ncbi:Lrp/AsnC family transcriptional regulator [Candidatus Woesearchaeota archaeon]|nr:Lrp/AsnC family transcriptional regulator [Candidatus Woesearchaeota archaeon]
MRVLEQLEHEKRIKLDLKDKKILALLAKDARTPNTIISKKVGLSRDAVSYRIKNLVKNRVVQGYRTLVNVESLGYDVYHLFIQLNPPSKEAEKEIIDKFKAYPFERAVLKFSDKYDYELAIVARSIAELDEIVSRIITDCKDYLQDYEILTITKFYVENSFPKSFLETNEQMPVAQNKKIEKIKIDKQDFEILRILANNADLPLYSLANKLKVSADTIKYRLKRMMSSGIIKKFMPVINYSSLGYTIYALLLNIKGLSDKREAKLKQVLSTDPNLLWAVKTIGRFNVLMYVCAQSTEEFHKTLINIRSNFQGEINHYETLIAYAEYKYTYFPEGIMLDEKTEKENVKEKKSKK